LNPTRHEGYGVECLTWRQEGGCEQTRGEREYDQALPESVSGFSSAQAWLDDLCFAGGVGGMGGTSEDQEMSNLRDYSSRLIP